MNQTNEQLNVILTDEEFDQAISLLKANTSKIVTFDTETNGLDLLNSVIIGFSFSFNDKEGFYCPILKWEDGKFLTMDEKKVYEDSEIAQANFKLEEKYLNLIRLLSECKLVMHNANFDCSIVYNSCGIDLVDSLFCDTQLLAHFINENERKALKEVAKLYAEELGFSEEDLVKEQTEMGESVLSRNGTFNKTSKEIWKADWKFIAKYGAKDTILTYKVLNVLMNKLKTEYEEKHYKLFFEDEIMPLYKEVTIPMNRNGVRINPEHFRSLKEALNRELNKLEFAFIESIKKDLVDFTLAPSVDKVITNRDIAIKIIQKEGLSLPTLKDKISFAKKAIEKSYQNEPHWVFGWLLGLDEIKMPVNDLENLKWDIYRAKTGHNYPFNLNSSDHLRWLLFYKKQINPEDYLSFKDYTDKTKKPSTKAEVLEKLLNTAPFLKNVILHRKLAKLLNTYVIPILELEKDSTLRITFNQDGTLSGRFSCSGGVNLQTLPKVEELSICERCDSKNVKATKKSSLLADVHCLDCKFENNDIILYSTIKEGFVTLSGYKIVNSDFSSLEPRAFSFMSSDPKLKAVYQQKLDLYSKVYCDMFDDENKYSADPKSPNFLKNKNPALRAQVKFMVLGIPYGSGANKVAEMMDLKLENGNPNLKAAQAYIDKYLSTYENLKKYMEECEVEAIVKGYVETIFGRRRRFQLAPIMLPFFTKRGIDYEDFMNAPSSMLKDTRFTIFSGSMNDYDLKEIAQKAGISYFKIRENGNWKYIRSIFKNELNNAKNFKIQGLAAHITNRAMLELTRAFKSNKIDGRIFLQVHDEISCYVKEDQATIGAKLLKNAMEHNLFTDQLDVPMESNPIICNNLKDSK